MLAELAAIEKREMRLRTVHGLSVEDGLRQVLRVFTRARLFSIYPDAIIMSFLARRDSIRWPMYNVIPQVHVSRQQLSSRNT